MIDLKDSPAYTCSAYREMQRAWEIVRDVRGGTLRLRELGKRYLPKEEAESEKAWKIRRDRAVLYNALLRTEQALVGLVFRKPPELGELVPAAIRSHLENVDLMNTHWTVWAKELFADAMDGHALIYVDMPPALPEGATLEDERIVGRRPYWLSYRADQILNPILEQEKRTITLSNGSTVTVPTGRQVLTKLVLKECSTERDGAYGEKPVVRYRELVPGGWILHREVVEKGMTTTVIDAEGVTSLDEIPVSVVYTKKVSAFRSEPLLLDMALLNLAHYQKYSDYSTYIHVSKPVLCRKTNNPKTPIEPLGPLSLFNVPIDGDLKVVEPTGSGLAPSREDLKDIEARMAVLGMAVLAERRTAPATATEELLDHVKEESALATAAQSLKDALEQALLFHARYLGLEDGGSIELGSTMEELTLSPEELQAWSGLVKERQLPLEEFWSILRRAGKLSADFDPERARRLLSSLTDQPAVTPELAPDPAPMVA